MKNIEALNIIGALVAIAGSGAAVPTKFAYASTINRKRLADIGEAFNETHKALIDKYGERDAEGKLIEKDGKFTITDVAAFNAEFIDLGETQVEVKLHQIPLESFPGEISLANMDALMPMVLEPEGSAA